jgi:hypothetical protein
MDLNAGLQEDVSNVYIIFIICLYYLFLCPWSLVPNREPVSWSKNIICRVVKCTAFLWARLQRSAQNICIWEERIVLFSSWRMCVRQFHSHYYHSPPREVRPTLWKLLSWWIINDIYVNCYWPILRRLYVLSCTRREYDFRYCVAGT